MALTALSYRGVIVQGDAIHFNREGGSTMRVLIFVLCCLPLAALGQGFTGPAYTPPPTEARVPWYTLRPDLGNVANRKVLPSLTPQQRQALATYNFVARPTKEEQLFYIYENNAYKKIGSFVTTDSVLHTYHIFYDFTLRYLERERLFPAATALSRRMLEVNLAALRDGQHEPSIAKALTKNAAYFAVPLALLGKQPALPADVQALVDGELTRIAAHKGRDYCVTGVKIDYSQFIPRGHYTRTKAFEQYFRAMMWYGLVPLRLEVRKGGPMDVPATIQALIITAQLAGDADARALWQQLYDPTVFYVGKADDLSYYDYAPTARRVFPDLAIDSFADAGKLQEFYTLAQRELPHPRIEVFTEDGGIQGQEFRFMGQRFIPDSRVLQELCIPKVGTLENPRTMPKGLDVFAALGSPRALQLLTRVYHQDTYANYLNQMQKMQAETAAYTPQEWRQNLYYGWMYCLLPLLHPRPEGYPAFMRNIAWQDKSLLTALGSWTELRHDTILYAKQSVAECGEGGDEPPPVHGYVEPEPEVYARLSWLLKLNKQGLQERKLIGERDEISYSFDRFIALADFLTRVSIKELRTEPLTRDELRLIEKYGGELEWLMLTVASLGEDERVSSWWEIQNKTDRSMALVADVHTGDRGGVAHALEEAIGHAAELWVVVPIQGKLTAVRGAIFTYYEFTHPASDRLTDEAWQQRLQQGNIPPMPSWTERFLIGPGSNTPVPTYEMENATTGC
jgi:hypothetical protein